MATAAERKADAWVASGGPSQEQVNSTIDRANSGDTSGFTARDWAIVRANAGYTTPAASSAQQSDGSANQSPGSQMSEAELQKQADDAAMARQIQQQNYEKAMLESENRKRVDNAIEVAKSLMTQYNLTSLYDKIVGYVRDGYEPDAALMMLRNTPEYKQRFPAMEALSQKGRSISESEYIAYERNAAQLEQLYGLPKGMIQNNVTTLLTNEVSGDELQERVVLSAAASVTAPQDLKNTLKNYYGIDSGGLAGYFLDPAIATPLLERQFATAVIGTEALRQDVNVGLDIAQNLQQLGVTQEEAREGFGQVRRLEGLTRGKGDRVNQQQLIGGTFGQAEQGRQIEQAQSARRARFETGGQFVTEQSGVSGLGTSTT